MRLLATVLLCWTALAIPVGILVGRLLRHLPTPPPPPVDDWTPVAVDREFASIVAEWAQR